MHRPLVVPLDGTPRAEEAIAFARGMATASGSPIHLVRVHRASNALRSGSARSRAGVDTVGRIRQGEIAYLRAVAGKLVSDLGHSRVRAVLLDGAVGEAILDYVRDVNAAAIVIAPRRRQGLALSLFGGLSDYLIRYAPAPVVLVRRSPGRSHHPDGFRKVLVPVAGESTEIVLRSVSALMPGHAPTFVLLHFVDTAHTLDVDGSIARLDARDRNLAGPGTAVRSARGLLRTALSFSGHGERTEVVARTGLTPRQAIAEAVAEVDPDLVAILARARSRFGRWFPGWETRDVVRDAGRPVLVIGPRAAEGDYTTGRRQEAPSGPVPVHRRPVPHSLSVPPHQGWRPGWTRGSGRRRRGDPTARK